VISQPITQCGVQVILADGTLRTATCRRYASHLSHHIDHQDGQEIAFIVTITDDPRAPRVWLRRKEGILP
jgi:hypothetical protein